MKMSRYLSIVILVTSFLGWISSAYANPTGGQVVAGNASLTETNGALTINQTSPRAILNWDKFDIAPNEHTHFRLPNINAITLNRITGNNVSHIFGELSST